MGMSDAELVPRLRTDPAALDAFYRGNVGRVTRFAARRCTSPADVADVVSATFMTAIDAAASFDPRRGTPRAWLLGIAAHELAHLYRRAGRERRAAAKYAGRRLLDEDDHARLEAQIEAQRLAPAVRDALGMAPQSERELFLLVAADGLTVTEAAQVLGIRATAARARLARVRRRLRPTVLEAL